MSEWAETYDHDGIGIPRLCFWDGRKSSPHITVYRRYIHKVECLSIRWQGIYWAGAGVATTMNIGMHVVFYMPVMWNAMNYLLMYAVMLLNEYPEHRGLASYDEMKRRVAVSFCKNY